MGSEDGNGRRRETREGPGPSGPLREPRLFLGQDMEEGHLLRFGPGEAVVFSSAHPAKQRPNEDATALIPFDHAAGVLALADGAGGHHGGAQASELALRKLAASLLRASEDEGGIREAILNGIEEASRAVAALGLGSATTMAVVEIHEDHVRPYHVGDSMILIVGQRGVTKLQTVPHSPTGYAVEAGFLDEEEALHHEHRHLVSNMVGAEDMRIEVGSRTGLAPRDTVLLASDGLFDNLHTEEIIELIRKGPIQRACSAVAAAGQARMKSLDELHPSKPDDLTFVLFRRLLPRRRSAAPASHDGEAGTDDVEGGPPQVS